MSKLMLVPNTYCSNLEWFTYITCRTFAHTNSFIHFLYYDFFSHCKTMEYHIWNYVRNQTCLFVCRYCLCLPWLTLHHIGTVLITRFMNSHLENFSFNRCALSSWLVKFLAYIICLRPSVVLRHGSVGIQYIALFNNGSNLYYEPWKNNPLLLSTK